MKNKNNIIYILTDTDREKTYFCSTFDKVKNKIYNLLEQKKKECDLKSVIDIYIEQQQQALNATEPSQIASPYSVQMVKID